MTQEQKRIICEALVQLLVLQHDYTEDDLTKLINEKCPNQMDKDEVILTLTTHIKELENEARNEYYDNLYENRHLWNEP